jgi:protein-S-isoprenylcysteine O-methyltransferase Ste14
MHPLGWLFWLDFFILFGPEYLGAIWQRSGKADKGADKGSKNVLVVGIIVSMIIGINAHYYVPMAMVSPHWVRMMALGSVLVWAGVALRWYAIYVLGRFFTRDVAIRPGHEIIQAGPYRWVRHPSYTGSLLGILGIAVCLDNWVSLGVIAVVCFAVFAYRMQVEEDALLAAFGADYHGYMRFTHRLVPWLY